MVAQNPDKGNCGQHVFVEHQLPDLKAQLDGLQQWILQAAQNGSSARDVERGLFDMVLALGKTLFQKFLQLVGPGDWGNDVTLDDGRVVHRSKEQHQRRQMTVFGACTVSRWVYAQRDKAKIEFCPTDQRLQLPASEVSYLLQEWDQLLGVEHAFGKVREVIETILRLSQSVDTLENTNQQMAAAAPLFRKEQAPVDLSKEGELLIVTEDNKGIPMVRPVEEKPTGAHRTKGEKANKKQMACIGCIYSVDPHVRTPEQLVATLFRDPDRPTEQEHQAQNKRYWVELSRTLADEEVRGQDLVFQHLRGNQHAAKTWAMVDPSLRRPRVVGNGSASLSAGGHPHDRHLGLDARAATRMGGGSCVPQRRQRPGMRVCACSPHADSAWQGRQGDHKLAAQGDTQRSARNQEKSAAQDLQFFGEEQTPHALR